MLYLLKPRAKNNLPLSTRILEYNVAAVLHNPLSSACPGGGGVAVVEYESNDARHCFRDKFRPSVQSYPA